MPIRYTNTFNGCDNNFILEIDFASGDEEEEEDDEQGDEEEDGKGTATHFIIRWYLFAWLIKRKRIEIEKCEMYAVMVT